MKQETKTVTAVNWFMSLSVDERIRLSNLYFPQNAEDNLDLEDEEIQSIYETEIKELHEWEQDKGISKPAPSSTVERIEHAPAPWRFIERDDPANSSIPFGIEKVWGNAVEPIADICNFPPATAGQIERQRANAAYICKAVNSHDELVEALDMCRAYLQGTRQFEKGSEFEAQILAALQKAKG